ncbi:hypothetical protein [Terrisporobacter mayombei]|uniref:hypothetical protein n=1 Tax=Terrisporobacter mayombei TaxID=1541 RepID=UPI001D15FD4A|nr:hypothetical protein [Terrisporobacter mayombei]MCC3867053.1 hypothetical protein [Terrisporobacter mayombei]
MKHYIELGLINDEYYNVNLRNIHLGKFEQNEEEKFTAINKEENKVFINNCYVYKF